jgi:S-(hydroxymethyl)glutathione dehydrogenase/alcohol dehydrogenase
VEEARVVVTGMGSAFDSDVKMGLFELTSLEKEVRGSLFGSANPRAEIPALLELYRLGRLNLDGLVTTRYQLEQINQGYQDMRNGSNLRGLIVYTDADR